MWNKEDIINCIVDNFHDKCYYTCANYKKKDTYDNCKHCLQADYIKYVVDLVNKQDKVEIKAAKEDEEL